MEPRKPPAVEQNHLLSEMQHEIRVIGTRGASRRTWTVRALWAWGFGWAVFFAWPWVSGSAWPWVLQNVHVTDVFLFLLLALWFLAHLPPKDAGNGS